MKYLKITQKKNNQKYIENLLKTYPKISSGRTKYAKHYTRILKNLLLTKAFDLLQKEGKIEPPTETTFGNKPLTINLKVGGNPDKVVEAVQSNEGFQATNSVTDLLDKWENKQLEPLRQAELNAFKKTNNGQSCPTPNMDDYVRKTGIPCVACSNF